LKEVMRRCGREWCWEIEQGDFSIEEVNAIINHTLENTLWVPTDSPKIGDAVLLGTNHRWSHVCPVVTGHGDILHTSQGSLGVVLITTDRMRMWNYMQQQAYRWLG
jgi:hypothetical protein